MSAPAQKLLWPIAVRVVGLNPGQVPSMEIDYETDTLTAEDWNRLTQQQREELLFAAFGVS